MRTYDVVIGELCENLSLLSKEIGKIARSVYTDRDWETLMFLY
jgi:hypothetical protein